MPIIPLTTYNSINSKDRFLAFEPIWKEHLFPTTMPAYLLPVSNTYQNLDRRRMFLQSRLMIHEMADTYLGVPNEFKILKEELDKPFGMIGSSPVSVSISHTQKAVTVMLDFHKEIGIDAECIDRKTPQHLRIRILHPDESQNKQLMSIDTIMLWVVKESILKLLGSGLRRSMSSICIHSCSNHRYQCTVDGKEIESNVITYENHYIAISEYI